MPLVDLGHRKLFLTLFAVFTICGTSMTIIGAALPKVLVSFGQSYFVAGLVLAANAIAYFSFTFVGGYAIGCLIFYPTVTTLLGDCFPHAQSQANGFAATGGGMGAFLFPFLMSASADGWGIRAGFATYAIFAVVLTLAAIGLARAAGRYVTRTRSPSSRQSP